MNLSDDEVIAQIKIWKKEYFEIITQRYLKKISNYIYWLVNYNKDIVEDLAHDVFLKVWNNLDKYEWGNFNARIYKITHWICVNYIASNNDNHFDRDNVEIKDNFDKNNINKEYKKKLIIKILGKIDEDYKTVILLYYFEEKSYDEIAEIMGKPKNTIWTYINRAKTKIKELVQNDKTLLDAINL